jgi:TM2 domain-containing membrane protein YozV
VGVAFGLWALFIVGFAGIHRFYAGRYVTGVIWLFTWGLAGIGSFVDLFLISGMVEEKNLELAALRSVMRSEVPTA